MVHEEFFIFLTQTRTVTDRISELTKANHFKRVNPVYHISFKRQSTVFYLEILFEK